MKRISILFALLLCIGFTVAQDLAKTLALLDGCFAFVNDTDLTTGLQSDTNSPRGLIIYAPAYKGASYGNMSVMFGQAPAGTDPASMLASFIAYAGGYQVDVTAGNIVHHYPNISSNAAAGPGSDVVRHFQFLDNGNYLNLVTEAATSSNGHAGSLYWKRCFPILTTDQCSATVSLIARAGSQWYSNGVNNQLYDIQITNNGASQLSSLSFHIVTSGASITQSWNIAHQSGDIYSATSPSAFTAGASSTDAGFVLSGTNLSPSISIAAISC